MALTCSRMRAAQHPVHQVRTLASCQHALPSIIAFCSPAARRREVVPGGYGSVKVHVKLGVPLPDKRIDEDAIKQARCDAAADACHFALQCML